MIHIFFAILTLCSLIHTADNNQNDIRKQWDQYLCPDTTHRPAWIVTPPWPQEDADGNFIKKRTDYCPKTPRAKTCPSNVKAWYPTKQHKLAVKKIKEQATEKQNRNIIKQCLASIITNIEDQNNRLRISETKMPTINDLEFERQIARIHPKSSPKPQQKRIVRTTKIPQNQSNCTIQ